MWRGRCWATLHLATFMAVLIAWTVALLSPVPQKSAEKVLGDEFWVFLFGKSLHVGSYALLTVLGGTATVFGRKWVWLLPALVVHGGLTEFFQQFVGRTAAVRDVALDTVGISVGGLIVWGIRAIRRDALAAGRSSRE